MSLESFTVVVKRLPSPGDVWTPLCCIRVTDMLVVDRAGHHTCLSTTFKPPPQHNNHITMMIYLSSRYCFLISNFNQGVAYKRCVCAKMRF